MQMKCTDTFDDLFTNTCDFLYLLLLASTNHSKAQCQFLDVSGEVSSYGMLRSDSSVLTNWKPARWHVATSLMEQTNRLNKEYLEGPIIIQTAVSEIQPV